ncbi:MAG: hypothetical protein ACI389_02980 [Methanobrevibacter sp.]|uniref:hypothetical protein n=1 Tax=Methanobrevibacter sp. TaxID=66852 RepID=UPI003EFF5709
MIEDNIRVLRQAAKVSANNDYEIEKNWCVVAGNAELVDKVAYKAIASNHRVKILFREHVILKEGNLDKKFDFIMLYGNSIVIDEFKKFADQDGGAYVRILRKYLVENPNLMVLIAPDNVIKKTVSVLERSKLSFAILQDSQTTGFIDVDLSDNVKLPNFIKSALKPFYNANEVVLSTILISVDKKEEIKKVQSIATSNRIFVIDFKDIVTEE